MQRPDDIRTEIAAAREALAARQALLQSTVAGFNDRLRDGHTRLRPPGASSFDRRHSARIGFDVGNLHLVVARIEKDEFDANYLHQVGGIRADEVTEALALRESLSDLRDEIAGKQNQLSLYSLEGKTQ